MLGCCEVMHLPSCCSHGESSEEEDEEGRDSSCPPCELLAPSWKSLVEGWQNRQQLGARHSP